MAGCVFCLDKQGYTSWENWYQEELINDSCFTPEFHFGYYRKSEYKWYAAWLLKFVRSDSKENTRANLLPELKQGKRNLLISKQAQCACTFNFQLTVKNEVDLWTLNAVWRQPFTWNDCQLLCHILLFPLQLKSSNFYKSQVYPLWHQVSVPLPVPQTGTACAAAALPSLCGTGLCREFTLKLGKYPFS